MSASDLPEPLRDLARIDRELRWIDLAIDRALDSHNRERFQTLLRRRGELLAERNHLGGEHEPPC